MVGFFIMLIISYHFSYKKTIEVKNVVGKLRKEKSLLENAGSRIVSLQKENRYLDSILQSNDLSIENTFEQTLVQKITQFATKNNLKIVAYNTPHLFALNDTHLLSYIVEIKGSFRDLMLFANYIEQQRLAKLTSLTFTKKKNYRTRRNYLSCKLVLQRFSK
ncbi:MAG: hypothetical protein GKR88_12570 [Flavobacteriaceae bacterium]|nr:MAG: hypothetical protein GKR88_12570 [Flavobacteriaceae bacterium]